VVENANLRASKFLPILVAENKGFTTCEKSNFWASYWRKFPRSKHLEPLALRIGEIAFSIYQFVDNLITRSLVPLKSGFQQNGKIKF